MKRYFPVFMLFFCFTFAETIAFETPMSSYFDKTDQFFKAYVTDGQVNYGSLKRNQVLLRELVKLTGEIKPLRTEKKAFYINAYNILVINAVMKNFPLKSVMDLDGFFDKMKHKVAGEMLTLNELEKQRLMPIDKDARLHFVLVCAAKSCPPLANYAFRPEKLDQQLTERTKLSMDTDWFIRVDKKSRKVEASKIFEWYAADFGGKNGVIPFINKYRTIKIPTGYRLGFYEYNWGLNQY